MLTTIEMKQNAIAALTARINHDLKLANECFDTDLVIGKNVKIDFNLRGRAAGQAIMSGRKIAGMDNRKYTLRFNVNMMIMSEEAWWHLLDETVSHEIAHIVDFYQRQKSGHDSRWKFIHSMLGGNSHTYHKLATPTAEYLYNVHGKMVRLSAARHNRIQNQHAMYNVSVNGITRPILSSCFVEEVKKTVMTSVPTRKDEVAPYTVKTNVIDIQKKVAVAKAAKVVMPKVAALPVAANAADKKRHTAPSGLVVRHKPSKLADAIWAEGITGKDAFIAEYESRGGKSASSAFHSVHAWYVGK